MSFPTQTSQNLPFPYLNGVIVSSKHTRSLQFVGICVSTFCINKLYKQHPPTGDFCTGKTRNRAFMLLPKKEPHTIQLSIKLWQLAQPIQATQTNQKTKINPQNKPQEEVVHSKPLTTTNKQKNTNNNKPK